MNYLLQARSLLQISTVRAAMVLLPLALSVPQIQAAAILPIGTTFCTTAGDGAPGNCSGSSAQLVELNGVSGIKFFTNGPVVYTVPVPNFALTAEPVALSSSLNLQLTGTTSGSNGFLADSSLPIGIGFDLSAVGGTISDWSALFSIAGGESTTYFLGALGGLGGGIGITAADVGTFALDLPSGSPVTISVNLQVNWFSTEATSELSINVPRNSIDFNPARELIEAPEPSSIALMGLGLAGGLLYSRRKR